MSEESDKKSFLDLNLSDFRRHIMSDVEELNWTPATPGPKKKFKPDLSEVERLSRLNCTDGEIASFYGVNIKTVEREKKNNEAFAEAIEQGKNHGRLSLRRRQIQAAEEGNQALLVWLGKTVLNQKETVDHVAQITQVTMSQEEFKQARKESMEADDC